MDSLEIFTQVPVDPNTYYLVGLQVLGAPGFDWISPIGTSGVTIAAALNPCLGAWGCACVDGWKRALAPERGRCPAA